MEKEDEKKKQVMKYLRYSDGFHKIIVFGFVIETCYFVWKLKWAEVILSVLVITVFMVTHHWYWKKRIKDVFGRGHSIDSLLEP